MLQHFAADHDSGTALYFRGKTGRWLAEIEPNELGIGHRLPRQVERQRLDVETDQTRGRGFLAKLAKQRPAAAAEIDNDRIRLQIDTICDFAEDEPPAVPLCGIER